MKYLELPLSFTQLKRIHFQPLEDKVAAKLTPWIGRHVTMADRSTLVKAVHTCIDIYFVIVLDIPLEVLMKIDRIRRAFLWAALFKYLVENTMLIGRWCANLNIVEALDSRPHKITFST
jgi:hypothetical protein